MPGPKTKTLLSTQKCARAMLANVRWADRLGWAASGDALAMFLGAAPWEGPGTSELAQAVARYQHAQDLDVDGIIGKDTWARLTVDLAPEDSETGVVPAGVPPAPDGFEEVIALYGDPRPLIGPDGGLDEDNSALWQRQILGRGKLPFPIPLDPRNPAKVKSTFYAHRKLVGLFEAVFQEIARLGLQRQIHSWGGIYNFRPIRGTSKRLSLHAFGAAIDLNSETNQLGKEGDMNDAVVEIFRHFGFLWGGDFRTRPDPMHFQYATGY
jgi:D-alanyl-D-alanine carboxypeptidase-like protein/putative peptidoglycan binding protein